MSDYNSRVFEPAINYHCANCNLYMGIFLNPPLPRILVLSCSEIVAIQKSHSFIGSGTPCTVCGIARPPIVGIFRPFWSELYSCNEYLMIKANE